MFWHIDTGIDCSGPYCIPVPKAILAVGKNLSKRWLGITVQGIIETSVAHSSTDSVFFTCVFGGGERRCVGFDILLQILQITTRNGMEKLWGPFSCSTDKSGYFGVNQSGRGQPELVIIGNVAQHEIEVASRLCCRGANDVTVSCFNVWDNT